ncbi:hypothetical protein [Polyangium mundeleinium]|uniref:Dihydroneopterin aldolase/epimerase domain-containing protein n=1 Tax=Polyangium mundeleinium TaxID=2995306 RepID=A0ABT5F451_9BACT|nr:hypothetical protein [Polyangium mundeleinium]MDC0748881.1 hypothetical protein [Polyangium mundeleinium]
MTRPIYEGAYADVPPPGYHVISRLEKAGGEPLPVDVIKIPVLEPRDRVLECSYEILVNDLDDDASIRLIVEVVLGELTDHYYRDQADTITLVNLRTSARRTIPYPP